MLITLVILAAIDAAPGPVPALGTTSTAVSAKPKTLSEVAFGRKLGKGGVRGGTLSVAGAPALGAPASTAIDAATLEADAFQETWIKRNAEARGELAAASTELAQADSTLPAAVAYGRGAAHTQAILNQVRESALLPYRARVSAAQATVDGLREAARKAGAQPGWVR